MIDFSALRKSGALAKKPQNPREIYISLPKKSHKLSSYPRDIQGEVWQKWFERRTEPDLVIKMNTGGGKTIVGLLILQSSMQEGITPVVYVVPNKMLAAQALAEANSLGISATLDVDDHLFRSGKSILITHIHKLVNGRSVFGIKNGKRDILKLGAIVFDDAHTSLETIEEQFSLSIKKSDDGIYAKLFALFYDAIAHQNHSVTVEIQDGAPYRSLLVPFWSWQKNLSNVLAILSPHREDSSIGFNWPLVQEYLKHCHCVFSGNAVEITPHCIPIAMIPSISGAERRVFMTATLADDSVLSSHFGVSTKTIEIPIVPNSAGDVGDRIILAPQLIDPSVTDEECIQLARDIADEEHVNVVVIVPSKARANIWRSVANEVWIENEVDPGVIRLRNGENIGLVVLVNRYDGIDLIDNACRVLFLDGLPDVRRSIDVIKQGYLLGSSKVASQIAQRIEQGAGRGVRSIDDYCAVILMGKSLCAQVYTKGVRGKFSPATAAQLDLSEEVSSMVTGIVGVKELLKTQFLARNPEWVALSKERLSDLSYMPSAPDPLSVAIRAAFDFAEIGDYSSAITVMRECADSFSSDPTLGGLTRQYLADYTHCHDQVEAQKIQKMAVSLNRQLLKPIAGVSFVRSETAATSQAKACRDFATEYPDGNHYSLAFQSVVENLMVGEEHVPRFEAAMSEIADFIGLRGSRPETEQGSGPDVLWAMKQQEYLVIECKSGATADKVTKGYCNQLNGSKVWFDGHYADCSCSLLMVHPNSIIENAASLNEGTRIMTFAKLAEFKAALNSFATTMALRFRTITVDEVRALLAANSLQSGSIFEKFSVSFRK
jgi:hypothetical protein